MRENFSSWINNLRVHEGFKSNDSRDPGKRTVHGISEVYHPEMYKDGKEPTESDIEPFYLREYWIPNGCDDLLFPLDVNHADSCVNPGPGAAAKFLHDTGEHSDVLWRTTEYVFLRERYYIERVRQNPKMLYAFRGWMIRCIDYWQNTVGVMTSLEGK